MSRLPIRVLARVMLAPIVLTSLLPGCATVFDSPRLLMDNADFHAISIRQANNATTTTAYSTLRVYPGHEGENWTKSKIDAQSKLVTKDCFAGTCWSVWAAESPTGPKCVPDRWNNVLMKMVAAEFYLLGDAQPLPMHLKLLLIPRSDGFIGSYSGTGTEQGPITFVFRQPGDISCSGTSLDKEPALSEDLMQVIGTVAYELQHLEYAAGKSNGPKPRLSESGLVKDEANSTCWMYSVEAALKLGTKHSLRIPTADGPTGDIITYLVGNNKTSHAAALMGPLVLWRDLPSYLANQDPTFEGTTEIVLSGNDRANIERVLSYCRAFTGYKGSVENKSMPTSLVKRGSFNLRLILDSLAYQHD